MSMKNPLTPAGIEPAAFRFVAQHLNRCQTAVSTKIQVFWDVGQCRLVVTDVSKNFIASIFTVKQSKKNYSSWNV